MLQQAAEKAIFAVNISRIHEVNGLQPKRESY